MPRENKKRGRRGEAQKRKAEGIEEHQNEEDGREHHPVQKKRKTLEQDTASPSPIQDSSQDIHESSTHDEQSNDMTFYGLLDEQEQEYFKRADGMLEVNQFATADERSLFLENVYKEADGKELKLACSQSCSRLLERLILLSTPVQLKKLFGKFSGQYLNLVQHRFASHCCETLFIQSAPLVSQELLASNAEELDDSTQPIVSMENLYLYAINELSDNLGYLMTDKFASHTLRVLLIVLSGQKLDVASANSVLRSKRKEHVEVVNSKASEGTILDSRSVPEAFNSCLENLISQSISGLDTHQLRTLATHPVANPMLQLLIQLELTHLGKQRAKEAGSIVRTLLPDDPLAEGTNSASFINGLIYDPIGSRLLESIVEYVPGKMFRVMYKELFKDRMGSLSRNEISAYVASKILERLSRDDLESAANLILPQIPSLIERGRTAIVKTLIERFEVRKVDTSPIANLLQTTYSDGEEEIVSIPKLLSLPPEVLTQERESTSQSNPVPSITSDLEHSSRPKSPKAELIRRPAMSAVSQVSKHASTLSQSMLKSPGPLSKMLFTALSQLPPYLCIHLALHSSLSPILQTALTVPHSPLIFRRKLITRFYSNIGSLSLDPSGSHVIDAIWKGTQGMAFVRERVAEELAENEKQLKESIYGRKVWRNWCMDLYRRRRGDWVRMMRESVGNDGFLSFPSDDKGNLAGESSTNGLKENSAPSAQGKWSSVKQDGHSRSNGQGKTKLDLSRERHARSLPAKRVSGANAAILAGNGGKAK